jgi:ketosteroid isomerase-like protein
VDGRGDLAYVRGTYVLTIAAMEGQPAMTDRGKYVEIWRRAGGREWRIAVDIFNSDQRAMMASSPPAQVRPNRAPRE